jgi:hypothetical protein
LAFRIEIILATASACAGFLNFSRHELLRWPGKGPDRPDPFAGSWTLNIGRFRLAGPYANLKSKTLVIQEQGDQLFIAANVTLSDGSSNSMNEAVARHGGAFLVFGLDLEQRGKLVHKE